MSVVSVTVDPEGVRIPLKDIEDLGLRPGDAVELQLSVVSQAENIRLAGIYYCWRKLGDALGVGLPVRQGDVWVSELKLRDRTDPVGRLVYSAAGEVLPERSSTKEQVLEAIGAASSPAAATR